MKSILAFLCLLPWLALAQVPTMPGGAVPWYRQVSGDGDTNVPSLLWWKANDGSGTHVTGDASGGGDDGTTSGTWATGESGSGYALAFSGGTGECAGSDAGIQFNTNAITVTFWFKANTTTTNQVLITTSDTIAASSTLPKWFIYILTGKLWFGCAGTAASWYVGNIPIQAATWVHVAIAFKTLSPSEGTVANVWTNAVSSAWSVGGDTMDTGGGKFSNTVVRVGGITNTANQALRGSVDDVRIFSGLLTAPEITNIYLHPK